MNSLLLEFEELKISALNKFSQLNHEEINKLTIGPNSICDTNLSTLNSTHSTSVKNRTNSKFPNDLTVKKPSSNKKLPKKSVEIKTTNESDKIGFPFRQIVSNIKNETQIKVQNAMQAHLHELKHHAQLLEKCNKSSWLKQQELFIKNVDQQEKHLLQALEEYDANKNNEHEKLLKYYEALADRRKKLEVNIQTKRKEREELCFVIASIKKNQLEFSKIYKEVISLAKSCQGNDDLKKSISEEFKSVKSLFEINDKLINKCKTGEINREDIKNSVLVLQQMLLIKQNIEQNVLQQNKSLESHSDAIQPKLSNSSIAKEDNLQVNEPSNDEKCETVKIDKYVSKYNLKHFSEMIQFLNDYSKSFTELTNDINMKQFRFDCKKAINLPINAISAVSPQHLLDKYNKLSNLLLGKNVLVSDSQINAMKHPQGIAFCTDFLAQRFILQGDLLISSNPDAAFSYATIINSLWNTFPNFGKLLLAYFYQNCPYIVPIYNPKLHEQTDEDFYKAQGYKYINGQIEKQDKFLKRMTGIMRLYSAILVTKPKSDQKSNPHGIEYGWKWLVSILKLYPRLDITATLLHTFIETAGYEMELIYGKAFEKLINIIAIKFMPILKKNDSGGPAARLDILLQDYRKKGHFEKPYGQLPVNYW